MALFSISADKATGPDGFSASFFQSNWGIIGPAICKEIRNFFILGNMPQSVNETYVRLIPKGLGLRNVSDYRPIGLCSVMYKIIAKMLTKRLKPILTNLISESQSAFVPEKAIADNVLITDEVLHFLKSSLAKKHCSMAVKTYMSKAYDMLEWEFIRLVLKKFGFHETWIKWVMECISTVSYSYLVNESPRGRVNLQRGIRQGDPLSSYIFILCSEVLSGLCRKVQLEGRLQGLRVSTRSPRVNHLLFADDTMFFCKTNRINIEALKSIVKEYEAASGQCINKEKSAITFSCKAPQELKNKVKAELSITQEGGVGKYLGLS
ncbi:putative mitochondrial protein [Cardamine amara subsp. amara]|uniref:Mitochondrial protein n=1 Tax=Cardamine amara subsp. amara TaxID=228776 RepID=A0ABD1BU10_CARAN